MSRIIIPLSFPLKAIGLPAIPVKLFDDKHILFLIDTGADISIMDISLFEYYKSRVMFSEKSEGIIMATHSTQETIQAQFEFSYEELRYTEVFRCMDCSMGFNQVQQDSGYQIHGIIGTNFLVKYRWIIDFEKQQIHI